MGAQPSIQKVKRNQDDLKELCESVVETASIIRSQIAAHGAKMAASFIGLCGDLASVLRELRTELEELLTRRTGILRRWKELMTAPATADQMTRYRNRINELRSNFTLVAAMEASLTASHIYERVSKFQTPPDNAPQVRNIPLGDINLLHNIPGLSNKMNIYTAQIYGEPSKMTVVKYEDEKAAWERDLALYSGIRHPNIWQLFGASTAPSLHLLIFHDELVPLPIYRKFYRPPSDLAWTYVEATLFRQFKDCSKYHQPWPGLGLSNKAAICVRMNPVQLCLTMPDAGTAQYNLDDINEVLCMWHTSLYKFQPSPPKVAMASMLEADHHPTLPAVLPNLLDWKQFYASLVASWHGSPPIILPSRYHLGAIVQKRYSPHCENPFSVLSSIPHKPEFRIKEWCQPPHPKDVGTIGSDHRRPVEWTRFTFPLGSFKAAFWPPQFPLMFFITIDEQDLEVFKVLWLSQSNRYLGRNTLEDTQRCGLIDTLFCNISFDTEFESLLREDGTVQEAHIFACPIEIISRGAHISIEFPESNQFYWSLDESGRTRLSQDECDNLGIPRLKFEYKCAASFWEPYHYNAIREFHQAKGFDPYGGAVTRHLGLDHLALERNPDPNSVGGG